MRSSAPWITADDRLLALRASPLPVRVLASAGGLAGLGEWPGALQPLALIEPYVTVSRHTAPTIRSGARTTRQ
jgi:hypothetical protein